MSHLVIDETYEGFLVYTMHRMGTNRTFYILQINGIEHSTLEINIPQEKIDYLISIRFSNTNLIRLPDLSQFNYLSSLSVVNNPYLIDILPEPILNTDTDDLSHLPIALQNSLRWYTPRLPTNLSELLIDNNPSLTSLPKIPMLQELIIVNNNNLTTLPDAIRYYMDPEHPMLQLTCANNNLTTLPNLSRFTKLKQLNCAYNILQSLPVLPNSVNSLVISIDQIGILINDNNTPTEALTSLNPEATIVIRDLIYFPDGQEKKIYIQILISFSSLIMILN